MPSLATTSQGPLGCGSYVVRLVNDGKPILEARKVTTVLWGRRPRGEVSTATVTLPVSGTDLKPCCDGVNLIDTLHTEIIIERNGIVVWQGWLLRDLSIRRDTIVINAHDILGWTERRTLKQNHVNVAVDLTDIALGYIADINSAGDLPFVITSALTGILATRTVLATEDRYASEPLRELYETGLDATVVGGHLLLGPQDCGTIRLRDNDIDGDPEIKLDGAQRASRIVVKGANGIRSVYPPVEPDICYHAADFVHSDENILDQASADATAIELYMQMSASHPYNLTIPEGSTLRPTAPVHINALIPGSFVQFHTQALCVELEMAFRLTALDVEAAAGSEQVRPFLEPLGDDEGD